MRSLTLSLLLLLAALFAISLDAQITATFDQQGSSELKSATGKRIRGVGLLATAICLAPTSTVSRVVDTEWVYSYASQAGIPRIIPAEAILMLTQQASRSPYNIGLETTVDVGAPVVSALAAVGKIGNGFGWVGLAPLAITLGRNILGRFSPDTSVVVAKLLQGQFTLAPGACLAGGATVLYYYTGPWKPSPTKVVTIP